MKSNKTIALIISIFLLSALNLFAADTKPNILFIAVDDLNAWVTHLGYHPQAKTPNIDRLAAAGITFTKAYCAAPACEPSRAALMSGQRPSTTGCYKNGQSWKKIIKEGQGLTVPFLKAGYYVVGAGKIYHGEQRFESEWTEYMDTKGLSPTGRVPKMEGFHLPFKGDIKDEDISDWHVVNYCIDRLKRDHDKPFFIACGLHKPHLPFAAPKKYYKDFPLESIQLPPHLENDLDDIPPAGIKMANPQGDHARFLKSGRWKAAIRSYLATCAYTDMNIGRLLDALNASKYKDNTIIVLWGDHGWNLGEKEHWRKFALWEETVRVPFIWSAPGTIKPGTTCESPVDLMSVFPTLCDLADIPIPTYVEGKSIATLLSNPKAQWNEPAICTHGYMNHTVRTDKWRYIRYANGDEELYDHSKDPYGWHNLANSPETKSIRKELAELLPKKNIADPSKMN